MSNIAMPTPIFLSDWTFVRVAGRKEEVGALLYSKGIVVKGLDTSAIMKNKSFIRRAFARTLSKNVNDKDKKVAKLQEQYSPRSVTLTKEIGVAND